MFNKIVAKTHQIQIFGGKPIELVKCTKSSLVPAAKFSNFFIGVHSGGNKEAFPYCAIKSVIFKQL